MLTLSNAETRVQLVYVFHHPHGKQKGYICILSSLNYTSPLIWVESFTSYCSNQAVKAPVGVLADCTVKAQHKQTHNSKPSLPGGVNHAVSLRLPGRF